MAQASQNIWTQLERNWDRLMDVHLREFFANDENRFETFSRTLDDLTIDFSNERIDRQAFEKLLELAKVRGIKAAKDSMFAGEAINTTEDREVLHIALRAEREDGYIVDGMPTADLVEPERERFLKFADQIRDGALTNANGDKFTDVINIGIGGSDLGPVMAVRALDAFRGGGPNVHFVSNVDGAHLTDVTQSLDPETTLVLIASKTFTTRETLSNARSAKEWLQTSLEGTKADGNLAALSTNMSETAAFGIPPERVFGFWDWVGGRYSVCSSIGLSVAISIGSDHFRDFLSGFRDMDLHFKSAPLDQNLPVILALIGVWRRNLMDCSSVALLPYDQRLEFFADYVQQMDMESNGKRVTKDGQKVGMHTSPVIWGTPGTNSQHSYFQMLHQGTEVTPLDFILAARSPTDLEDQHTQLTANFLAQSSALALGKTGDEVREEMKAKGVDADKIEALVPHRTFPGNRPSTSIIYRESNPYSLGRLIALYEHKVFVQGVIWGVNSFDQWGVELGKQMAVKIEPLLGEGADLSELKGSTGRLIERIRELRK